jgi:hypothetical protein
MPQTQCAQPEFRSETDLELAIAAAMQRLCDAPERAEKMRHWREMVRLIDQRTPHRVRFMERMAGL